MARQATISAILSVKTKEFITGLERAQKGLDKFSSTATRAGRDLTLAISAPLLALGRAAIQVASDFELAQAKIGAIKGEGGIIEDLATQARDLGENTIFSATAVSELQLSLARLGSSTEQIQALTPTVLKLSQALDTELAPTGEFLVQTMNKFERSLVGVGDEAQQATYVANLFAKATAESTLTAEKLQSALNFSGAEAASFGFTLAETVSILGVLSKRGFDASRGGTAFRRILQQIAKDGFSAREAVGVLFDETKGFREELETYGLRGAGPRSSLGTASAQAEQAALQAQLESATGFIDTIQGQLNVTLYAELEKLQSALRESALVIADSLGPQFKELIQYLTDLVKKFNEADPSTQSFAVGVSAILAVAGPLLLVIGGLAKALALVLKPLSFIANLLRSSVVGLFSRLSSLFSGIAKVAPQAGRSISSFGSRIGGVVSRYLGPLAAGLGFATAAYQEFKKLDKEELILSGIETGSKRVEDFTSYTKERLAEIVEEYKALSEDTEKYLNSYGANLDKIISGEQALGDFGLVVDNKTIKERVGAIANLKKLVDSIPRDYFDLTIDIEVENLPSDRELKGMEKVYEIIGKEIPGGTQEENKKRIRELLYEYFQLEQQLYLLNEAFRLNKLAVGPTELRELDALKSKIKDVTDTLKAYGQSIPGDSAVDTSLFRPLSNDGEEYLDALPVLTYVEALEGFEQVTATARDSLSAYDEIAQKVSLSLNTLSSDFEATSTAQQTNAEAASSLIGLWSQQANVYDDAAKSARILGNVDLANSYRDQANALREQIKTQEYIIELNEYVKKSVVSVTTALTNAFFTAGKSGEGFFKGLLKNLLSVFGQLMAKLIALIAAYGILAVLSGGTSAIAGAAKVAMGDNIGSFLMNGFGVPQKSVQATPGVRGFVSGHNLVLAGSRGVTATDRIYG